MVCVSVIMPAYNCEQYIGGAIDSVLAQEDIDLECIVVNDASTDGTAEVLSAYSDPRLRVLEQETTRGAAVARNRGIETANGRFIAFLDADDIWRPGKLSKQVHEMENNEWALSYTTYDLIDGSGRRIGGSGSLAPSVTYRGLLKGCIIQNSTAIYDTKVLGQKHYCPDLRKRQDFGLFLSILRSGSKGFLSKAADSSCAYRVNVGGISSKKSKNIKYQWRVYRDVEGIGNLRSLYYMSHWFVYAANKSRKRLKE